MPAVKKAGFTTEKSKEFLAEFNRVVARSVGRSHDLFLASAQGATLTDVDGNAYVDFAGGIGVLNVGHRHPRVVAAVQAQLERFLHSCLHVMPYEGYLRVCERLVRAAPGTFPKKALLFNSGAEAVENAVKTARASTKRAGIICFDNAFHGRTFMALALTGKEKPYRAGFAPFPGEVYRAPYPYPYRPPAGVAPDAVTRHSLKAVEALLNHQTAPERVAAVLVEPVLGEGGFVVPPPDFLPGLRKLCDKHGILLIADEIQTGFGRTGRMFAVEHSGVVPDLMTVAKSLAAGLPLSGLVGRAEVMDAAEPGGQGGTYGGNPLACAAALAVFEAFEKEGLLARSAEVGRRLEDRFAAFQEAYPCVGEARGLGAMRALELVRSRETRDPSPEVDVKWILGECAKRGLLLLKCGQHSNVLRCLVPFTATDAELGRGLDVLESVLKEYSSR